MRQILSGLAVFVALGGSCNAGVLYSFDGTITESNQPGPGWAVGDTLHGSFVWAPEQFTERQNNCWFNADRGMTISSEFSAVIGTAGFNVACGREGFLFIDLQGPIVTAADFQTGHLDVIDLIFDGPGLVNDSLPGDLDALTPRVIAFQWLFPSSNVTATFELHRAAVPEPSTWGLMLVSLVLLVSLRRQLKKNSITS